MELIHCRNCGHPYMPGEASYCTKCGELLSTKTNLIDEIKQLEREPKPYEALRFTSGLIVFLGWMVIIFGWLFAFTTGAVLSETIAKVFVSDGSSYSVVSNMTYLISTILGMVNTIFGISMIAAGQVIALMLDIRNDTHTTMRLVRRFGLLMSDDKGGG